MKHSLLLLACAAAALWLLAAGCRDSRPSSDVYVVTQSTAFYRDAPQQSRPPDGTLDAGVRVTLLEEAGSYVRVRPEGETDAVYIAADSIRRREP